MTLLAVVAPALAALLCAVAIGGEASSRTRIRLGVPTVPRRSRRRPGSLRDAIVLIVAAVGGWAIARLPGTVVGLAVAIGVRSGRERRALRIVPTVAQERTADAIGGLSAAVRAGASLPQALRYAADEAGEPIRSELNGVVGDLNTGMPLEAALATWGERSGSPDTHLVVGALRLHHRSGGDLPSVLDQVAETIRERIAIARETRSLTAQARLSAWILGLLPIGFFAFLVLTARRDIGAALTTPIGIASVVAGLVLEGLAFLWIRSLLEVR
jgi:tight adherence protein B